eukprot:363330-Chlamydomonas_euryale.AAC.16
MHTEHGVLAAHGAFVHQRTTLATGAPLMLSWITPSQAAHAPPPACHAEPAAASRVHGSLRQDQRETAARSGND